METVFHEAFEMLTCVNNPPLETEAFEPIQVLLKDLAAHLQSLRSFHSAGSVPRDLEDAINVTESIENIRNCSKILF